MPRKALPTEFTQTSAGTRTRVELLPGELIAFDKVPHYTIASERVGSEYQLPQLPDEWMFGDRDMYIRDSTPSLGGAYRGMRALKAGNLYMEWEIGGKGSFGVRVYRIDSASRQVRFLTGIDNYRFGSLVLEDIVPFHRELDLLRTIVGSRLSLEQRRNFNAFCMPIREGIYGLAQGAADVDSAAIIQGIIAARAQMDMLVAEAHARLAAGAAAGAGGIVAPVGGAGGAAGGASSVRPYIFFIENPAAEPANLQELANKLFSIWVENIGLSITDTEGAIRAYAAKHRVEVFAADFPDKLGNCIVEIGGGSRTKLLGYFDSGVSSIHEARNGAMGISSEPLPFTDTSWMTGAGGAAGGRPANSRALGASLTESVSRVGRAATALVRGADSSTLQEKMLTALAGAKPRFDRALAEKDPRAVGNIFLVMDEALFAIQPSVRASVGSWDAIDAAHRAASISFASWVDAIVTHPDEKFREQCIAKLVWRGEGPILRYWITPTMAQKLLLALNQDKDELKDFQTDSEWTPKESINLAALLTSRYLTIPCVENQAFLKHAITSYPKTMLFKFLIEGGVPVTADLYKFALENGHYMAATLMASNLTSRECMWVSVAVHKAKMEEINSGYDETAKSLLNRLNILINYNGEDESVPCIGSTSVQQSMLVAELKGGLTARQLKLRSIKELDDRATRNFKKESKASQDELVSIIEANNDLVRHIVNARSQVLLTRLNDVIDACGSLVMVRAVLEPLKAHLLAKDKLEPFSEVVFSNYERRMYDNVKPAELRQAVHDIVNEYNVMIAATKGEPLPSLLATAYLLGGGASVSAAATHTGAVAAAGGAGASGGGAVAAGVGVVSTAPAVGGVALAPARPLNQFLGEAADLFVYPPAATPLGATEQIAIGDLHANPVKLLYSLLRHGVVTLPKADYDAFVNLYKAACENRVLTPELLASYRAILSRVSLVPGAAGKVTLIGDETSDRGPNDLLILELLGRMQELDINYEVLLSNHGVEFVESYETARGFGNSLLMPQHRISMLGLHESITSGLVTAEEVKALIERAYKPSLKLLSYVVSDDSKEINIFSHAGIGWQSLEGLCRHLEVPYLHDTVAELAATIDRINAAFATKRDLNQVHTLYNEAAMMTGYGGMAPLSPVAHPVEFAIWNRFYEPACTDRTSAGHSYKVSFTHGHDSDDPLPANTYCLDSNIGKHHATPYHIGGYNVLVTRGVPSPQVLSSHSVSATGVRAAEGLASHGVFRGAAGGAAGGTVAASPYPPTAGPGAGRRE